MQRRGSSGVQLIDRYAIFDQIASGGMASIYLGRELGISPPHTVAIKRLHPHFANDPDFLSMFVDEARVAARIRHHNVVETLEVVSVDGEPFLVMELVLGESLGKLLRACRDQGQRVPPRVAARIVAGVLHGLQAAHDATSESGEPLHIVHRDVSPQNVFVGADGVARVLDFGVAKARGRLQTTREGQLKGKLAYMGPEQLDGRGVDRRTDVFSAGAVLWEVLIGRRVFDGLNEAVVLRQLIAPKVTPPSEIDPDLAPFDPIVAKALAGDPDERFESALAMATALEAATEPATCDEVGAWVEALAGPAILRRRKRAKEIEQAKLPAPPTPTVSAPVPSSPVPTPEPNPEGPAIHSERDQAPFAAALEASEPPPPPAPAEDTSDMGTETLPLYDRTASPSAPPSHVSSVSLASQLSVPPPLPPGRVKLLALVGIAAASFVSFTLVLLLSFMSRPKPDTARHPATRAPAAAAPAATSSAPAADPASAPSASSEVPTADAPAASAEPTSRAAPSPSSPRLFPFRKPSPATSAR